MANVLVVGSGAREHCLAWKLKQSPKVSNVYVAPGNSCPFAVDKQDLSDANNIDQVRAFCRRKQIQLLVIGPEKEICDGWADELHEICLVFAPSKAASRLEASKSFAKQFMLRHQLPTAQFSSFTNEKQALEYVQSLNWLRFVIKEDGLCSGKGVYIVEGHVEATQIIRRLYANNLNSQILIEEFLEGYELSAMCFSDGRHIAVLPFSQDHKRAYDGDRGPNTGGMGAITPVYVSQRLEREIHELLQAVVDGMANEQALYKGVLYAGLMITADDKPKILEFNCRFGDPETQVLLPLLRIDLYDLCVKCAAGQLAANFCLEFESKYAACIVLASKGYPNKFAKDVPIKLISDERVQIFHAGMRQSEDGTLVTSGGRILSVVSIADTHFRAVTNCLEYLNRLDFSQGFYRFDIGRHLWSRNERFVDYEQSGVSIEAGNRLVDEIKVDCASTLMRGTNNIGGFGAFVDLHEMGFKQPQLVVGMDGVGTKLELATKARKFCSIGFDLVGMCANDVLCHGAAPKVFLDYYVTGKLKWEDAAQVVKSVANACKESECALVGGETAEMPGVYEAHQWDLAGCCVGVKEASSPTLPRLDLIEDGDILIGLASNGLHSNGFSLVRKTLRNHKVELEHPCPWNRATTFGDELLRPTKLYAKHLLPLIAHNQLKALAHITGGGLLENVPRMLPSHLSVEIECSAWEMPPIFKWLQRSGPVLAREMFRTFNCGIGMAIVASIKQHSEIVDYLKNKGVAAWTIGRVVTRAESADRVVLKSLHSIFKDVDFNFIWRPRINVAVLISGTGSNMKRLIEQSFTRGSHCHVSVVVSNKPNVKGLETAASMGLETLVIPHGKCRDEFELKLTKALEERNVQLICLVGFMRILTGTFVNRWRNRIINLHPSLLPSFKGAHAIKSALEAGVKVTGCTAHFVVEDVDAGEILAQEPVRIELGDTEESLHAKIQVREHQMFPEVMESVAAKMLQLEE